MVVNQSSITGPNIAPTRAVPALCTENSPTRMPMANGTTYGARTGVTVCSPSTALSTVIAGVIMPSP